MGQLQAVEHIVNTLREWFVSLWYLHPDGITSHVGSNEWTIVGSTEETKS